ncbi:hypothetical protein RHGRI_010772 [Rhododendron griersonianum]|nr:hypothetical protein RHGRI_010772 [Rhododendron griersonianum]
MTMSEEMQRTTIAMQMKIEAMQKDFDAMQMRLDCHSVMCGASLIAGREIVIRDNMRFHHFSDGKCSCGNFW